MKTIAEILMVKAKHGATQQMKTNAGNIVIFLRVMKDLHLLLSFATITQKSLTWDPTNALGLKFITNSGICTMFNDSYRVPRTARED